MEMKLSGAFALFTFLICFQFNSFCQDSLEVEEEEVDTVVIVKDPLVVKKVVYVQESKQPKYSKKKRMLEIGYSPIFTTNIYTPCPACETYLERLKNTTKPSTGYYLNLQFSYFIKNIFLSTGIGYKAYNEQFRYDSLDFHYDRLNTFKTICIPLSIGYRIINNNSFQLIPSIGTSLENFISINGQTPDEENYSLVKDISAVRNYYSFNYLGYFRIKGIVNFSESFGVALEPHLTMDFVGITKNFEPYSQKRRTWGISGNLVFKF